MDHDLAQAVNLERTFNMFESMRITLIKLSCIVLGRLRDTNWLYAAV